MEENNENNPKVPDTSQEGISRRASDTIYLKVLVPSIAAGAIIGKNGEAIGQMQKETGAKIKLSKLNDFYPGTTERVCLIQGPLPGVRAMHNYIMDRILEKPEISAPVVTPGGHIALSSPFPPSGVQPSSPESSPTTAAFGGCTFWPVTATAGVIPAQSLFTANRLLWERYKQVKILVPNCTAGLVIGKQGTYVSEIKEATGAFIQISQKSKDINLPERCITIAGEADQLRAAVDMVLTKIAEDPQSGTCPTISYSHAQGPVASAYPTGSPFAYTTPPPPPQPQVGASQPPSAAHTLLSVRHPAAASLVRQKSDGIIPPGAYYHSALQASYFAAAAAAAAAADYQQRLVVLNTGFSHQTHRGIESGEASGASSSLESASGGCGFVGPLTPSSGEGGAGDTSSPSFYTATTPLLPTAATSQMLATAAAATIYPSPTGCLESPLDPSGFPLLASSPPPPHQPKLFAASPVEAFFALPPLRASSPLSMGPSATVTTAAWLRSRGYSEEAVSEITHAMSTLSAHGVLNIGGATPHSPESAMIPLTPLPIAHHHQMPLAQDPPPKEEVSGAVEDSTADSAAAADP
nr:RNA binding protein Nova [Hymenolepis microstoma]